MNITDLVQQKAAMDADPEIIEAMKVISTIDNFKILTIKDDGQNVQYSTMFIQAKEVNKRLEERRKSLQDPYRRVIDSIAGYFEKMTSPVKAKIGLLDAALKKYRIQKIEDEKRAQERAQKETAKIETRLKEQGINIQIPAVVAPRRLSKIRTEAGLVSERKVWKVEVLDILALAKAVAEGAVPAYVLRADIPSLVALARNGVTNIPGCRVWEDMSLSTRRA